MIVGSAAREILFTSGDVESSEELAVRAGSTLEALDALLEGDSVEVPTIIAYGGVALDGEAVIRLPWGVARRPTDYEKELRLPSFADREASFVVQVPVSASFRVGEPDEEDIFDPEAMVSADRAQRLLPLAALLGLDRESYVVVDLLWQTTLLPGSFGSSYVGSAIGSSWIDRVIPPTPLSADDSAQLSEWSFRVDENYDPSIDVAIRRGLSAVRERINTEDAFIDAVIAMENLFGHGDKSEVSFRVTSAITILLEEDLRARDAFRSRLGKLYSARSKLVHGGTPDASRLHEYKEEAVEIMVRCLRTLFVSAPHLISDRSRGVRLILRTEESDA